METNRFRILAAVFGLTHFRGEISSPEIIVAWHRGGKWEGWAGSRNRYEWVQFDNVCDAVLSTLRVDREHQ